jgi:hypothetical protein
VLGELGRQLSLERVRLVGGSGVVDGRKGLTSSVYVAVGLGCDDAKSYLQSLGI